MARLHPSVFRHAATAERMRALIQKQGYVGNGKRLWSTEEDAVVRRHYPDIGAIRRALPDRTVCAIKFHAGKLGLRAKQRCWTGREVLQIREMAQRGERCAAIAHAMNATVPQIRDIRKRFKIYSPSRAPTEFDNPLIDTVRRRAKATNLSLRDLDREISRHGSYFGRADRTRAINIKLVERAVNVLGGRFQIIWDD